tara:strand:+ start:2500 stop:3135 length:636 start_codon:yes stop_codon:yes gene_type:complete
MLKKLFFIPRLLLKYKRKIFKVTIFEIYYSILKRRLYYKIQDHPERADSMPCPYYFIYKISKFIKKNSIDSAADLGSGNGRIVNFLSSKTKIKMYGYEIDKDMFNYSIKNLNINAKIENQDINLLNYTDLDVDCYILNTPFLKDEMLKNLIKKISLSKTNSEKKYYIIIINVDVILKKIKLSDIFENFKLIKFINAGPITSFRIYENLIIK